MQLAVVGVPYSVGTHGLEESTAPALWKTAGLVERLAPYATHAVWVTLPPVGAEKGEREKVCPIGSQLTDTVKTIRASSAIPLILGGDDLLTAVGAISGLQAAGEQPGIAWFHAHGRLQAGEAMNLLGGRSDPTLARALGLQQPVPEWHTLLAGIRDPQTNAVDLDDSALTVWSAETLWIGGADPLGLDLTEWPPIYLHVDLSVLDPLVMPAVRDPIPDGISLETLVAGIEAVTAAGQVIAVGVSNFIPEFDGGKQGLEVSMQVIEAAAKNLII